MTKAPRPDPIETAYSIRDGLVYINERNRVVVVSGASKRRTHIGALAAGAFEKYRGCFGVLFEGRTLDMVYDSEVDAGLNLLEVSSVKQESIYAFWARNQARSTRKLSPRTGDGNLVVQHTPSPGPDKGSAQLGDAATPSGTRTRGRRAATLLPSMESSEPPELPTGTFEGLLPEG